jgi:hypothetical protein
MTLDETIQKLIDLKLHALAKSLREMMEMPPDRQLSFEDKLGLLVDQEWTSRENRRVSRRVQEAKLSVRAAPEEILGDSARGLVHSTLRELSSCQWVRSHHNLLLLGTAGVGKSFLASALANAALRQGLRALLVRVPRLLEQRAIARASADYSAMLARLARSTSLFSTTRAQCPNHPRVIFQSIATIRRTRRIARSAAPAITRRHATACRNACCVSFALPAAVNSRAAIARIRHRRRRAIQTDEFTCLGSTRTCGGFACLATTRRPTGWCGIYEQSRAPELRWVESWGGS